MSSLVAIYRDSVERVAAMWNSVAEGLGFTLLRDLQPGEGGWDFLKRPSQDLFVGLYRHENVDGQDDWVRLLIEPGRGEHQLFMDILELPLRPIELFLSSYGWEFAQENLVCDSGGCAPSVQLDIIEANWTVWGVRALQAFHRDLLFPLGEWKATARERGFRLEQQGDYFILDVHSHDKVPWPENTDPLTGVPAFQNEDVARHMEASRGTVILIRFSTVEPNPKREYGPWVEALLRAVEVLYKSLSDSDTLTRFYTPREFLILKSGLVQRDAPLELARLRDILRRELDPLRLTGKISSASWPEEASNPDDMICLRGWDRLHDDEVSIEL